MTSVPKPTFGPKGFIAPSEADILAGVKADFNGAFGGDLNPADETPQGQLAVSLAAIIGNSNDIFSALINQVDPSYADGRMQDAIARIYFLTRNPSEPTTVAALIAGLPGTVIPIGALAKSVDGNIFSCSQAGVIGPAGTVTLSFANTAPGPVPLAPTALSVVYRAIPGWDSVTNTAAGILGRDVETRADFEARRAASVALNAAGTLPAIRASVLNVANVVDVYATENNTAGAVTIGGVSIAAHALFVSVAGGLAADVARAIWIKKNPGCGYTGTTTVVVTDNNSGYALPYPTYNVTFTIPSALPIGFVVSIANDATVPDNAVTLIKGAILAAFAGADGGPRARIGGTIFASRFYAGIAQLGPWAQIISITVGSPNSSGAVVTGSITGPTLTVTAVASGAIAVGQTVEGASVLPGTTVLSGSGASWVLSKTQTVASETLTFFVPTLNEVVARIDQIPTAAIDDISVVLV